MGRGRRSACRRPIRWRGYPPRVSRTPRYAAELGCALTLALRGLDERELAGATEALVTRYRSVAPAAEAILASPLRVAAYAAYRMPATHAALTRVLEELARRGLEPRSMLDLGGG